MKKVQITETVLRDAQQSLIATRMPRSDFADILETMDNAGYYSLECWGGATFDSCLRYLNEDPWERLRFIRSKCKKTKLQMLLRGQNILGYHHYSDNTVRAFVREAIQNGIDIIRIFDALNDYRNIEVAVDECLKNGGHAQGTICYTTSPIHTIENFIQLGISLEKMGCNSICIKDMAGIMTPEVAYQLVKGLKENVSIPVIVHTHSTTGLAPMTYLKAVEAGADGIDTAISSMSGGTSQPATESMVYALNEMGYDTGLTMEKLKPINDFFVPVRQKFIDNGTLNPLVMGTNINALNYQIPGGMLSNLIAQLKAQNALDRLDEVLEETPRVRKDLGYPPLVTPMSQMVGVQAVQNVLSGERYKNISKEVRAYLRGEYGRAPGEVNQELVAKALNGQKPIEGRFAETIEPEIPKAVQYLGTRARNEEDVLSYVAFPTQAEKFFETREERKALHVSYTIMKEGE
ncbi:pyruvate carboxylase subunit B [Catenisphaera adipataccumulans]|jgi:oxaloacetate decarboxylase alpha subunit|uniref:Oxaloacetate decarboxylase alpha subunit n=1 Tax=Catenisphaera adipataccumulans TaxID=700500 RepID=A0A7W8FWR3_9FIRM|nr:pyruvate carboxylase subunit B [Catenisphaera adipataccumulans]MBB5183566.1 oxaloacetate decarboxylase alpha subunit [Catenisphaera adipataccumulans]